MKDIIVLLFVLVLFFLPSVSRSEDFTVNVDNVKFPDLVRVAYGDILKRSYVLDKDVNDSSDLVSVHWNKVTPQQIEALMYELTRSRGFAVSDKAGALYFEISKYIRQTTETLIYKPNYRPSRYLSDLVSSLTSASPATKRAVANPISQSVSQSAQDLSPPASAAAQLDRANADTIVLNVPLGDSEKVRKLLSDLDTPVGEVMVRAAVYEVSQTKGQGGALVLVSNLLHTGTPTAVGVPVSGGNNISLGTGAFSVVLSTLDADSRFKTITRPSVRVRSGSQAKFTVGQSVPVLGNATLDKNGNPVQSVNYQPSGDILTVTPDVHGQVIDLEIDQEVSSFVSTTTGVNNSPTLQNRSVVSSLSVKSGELISIGGLTTSQTDHGASRLFGFNLAHSDDNTESEIVVLLTVEKL